MIKTEQGDILRVNGISWPVIVVSNNHFNQIGEAVVCPILNDIPQNAVHLPIRVSTHAGDIQGYIACEHIRHVDLNVRRYSRLTALKLTDFLDISDTLIALFDFR